MGLWQHTLNNPIQAAGVGLHSGRQIRLTLRPAAANTGIRFRRIDLDPVVEIQASAATVVDTRLATTLGVGDVRVGTVEHLLSALAGAGVDNLCIDVDAPELPIMDGSAAPFLFLLHSAGLRAQPARRRYLRITETVAHIEDDVTAMLKPGDGYRLEYTLDYDHPVLKEHSNRVCVDFSTSAYQRELSRARTFGLMTEFEALRERDLVRGGSLANALVVGQDGIVNEHGLRLRDEFARHKILDAMGDLALLGYPLIGTFVGYKSGHSANTALLDRLLSRDEAFEILTFETEAQLPPGYGPPAELALAESA
ncbi:MAG: UDP-3-O-acyl-N-acetylglucosamine deacetylase [Pseudomonadota bacterium]